EEPFKPRVEGKVSMYVCGITPYDFSHVGHARAYVAFDVLYRYLKFLGNEVEYVRNFTDIDDKIIRQANEAGETVESLSSRFINEFSLDMDELQCLPPTHEPRVTEHIKHIIELITKRIENGHAYAIEGDVYFSVDSFPEYLQLSGRMFGQNRAGERVAVDTRKRNPADFALWKSAKEGEPFWESPWGRGRPGWHIECSAMSAHYLGHVFDIHGGGKDLIFPHHENEVAQSQAAYPESEVKCWMHNGFVNKDDQPLTIIFFQIISLYHPTALRFFLIHTHYRSDVNHSDKGIENASQRVCYIYETLYDCEEVLSKYHQEGISIPVPDKKHNLVEKHHSKFLKYMSDDLKTTKVLDKSFMKLLRTINSDLDDLKICWYCFLCSCASNFQKLQQKLKQQQKKQQQPQKQPVDYIQDLNAMEIEIKDKLSVLGLMPPSSLAEVLKQLKGKALKRACLTEEQLQELIEQRTAARKNKQFEVSDGIRMHLASLGISLMDEPTGTIWRPCEPEWPEESGS
ncbi:hypothetical protein PVAP13_9KG577300, partial [Panicum virgatum]